MDYRNLDDWRKMDPDCTFACFAALEREKDAEIERLRYILSTYANIVTTYQLGRTPGPNAMDVVRKYWEGSQRTMVRLVATKDIEPHVQCAFSICKGEQISVDWKLWDPRHKTLRVITGHGTWEEIRGLEEVKQ